MACMFVNTVCICGLTCSGNDHMAFDLVNQTFNSCICVHVCTSLNAVVMLVLTNSVFVKHIG